MEASELECCVTVESLSSNGIVNKRRSYKSIKVVLGRDEFRDIALRIVSSQSPLGKTFLLKEISIHKRFVQEGKATIKLLTQRLQIMFSNCPPNQLTAFLKCLSLKLSQSKQNGHACNRKRLLSEKPRSFENVSPLTDKDFTWTSGSKKRPLDDKSALTPKRMKTSGKENQLTIGRDCGENGPARKRLNSLSSFQTNLTVEQMAVLNAVKAGKSVFFTGSAGTGKSYLLKRLLSMLPPQSTFVTASTGAAACHVGGTTLHAFAGIGSGSAPLAQCVELALRPGRAQKWRSCKHLIIDEISMVDSSYFDKLEAVARAVRKKDFPFGGVQLILSGDFLQLPPVVKDIEKKKFCFQAECWSDCVHTTIELKQVYRQKDPLFISILQNVRVGNCPDALVSRLTKTKNQAIEHRGIMATKLCTHKENVNQINEIHLSKLSGEKKVFYASDSDSSMSAMVDSQVPVGNTVELKEGAQVMLAKKLECVQRTC